MILWLGIILYVIGFFYSYYLWRKTFRNDTVYGEYTWDIVLSGFLAAFTSWIAVLAICITNNEHNFKGPNIPKWL